MEYVTLVTEYFSGFWGKVELAGTLFNLVCVYLAARHNQWTWPIGAVGVLIFGYLFYNFQLYSDASLQILFFLPMQVWGYMKWKELSEAASNYSVTLSLTIGNLVNVGAGIAVLTILTGYLMSNYTDASFPYGDAWTTWMSVFAQILMIKKYWQSWVLWVVMDAGAIYIYASKGLFVISGLYFIFLIIAAIGTIKWFNDWRKCDKMSLMNT